MYNRKFITGLLIAMLLFIGGCKKDKTPEKRGVFVSTSSISNITLVSATNKISATAGGDADLVGAESITERGVSWATTSKPTTTNNKITAGTGTGNFTADITGLTFGITYYVRAYVISNGNTYYGNEVKFLASVPVQMIKNGDFSLPNDVNVVRINSISSWKTDETGSNIGRSKDNNWDPSNFILWTNDWSKGFYQTVDPVPSAQSVYAIRFDANWNWTDWGDYKPTIGVIFSVYTGSDPTTRVPIDTVKFKEPNFFPGWGNNWRTRTGSFSIPAGSSYAGKNMVIEIDVFPYDDGSSGYDPNLWFDFDNISVIRTLK